jgi:hypothetical protein
MPQPDCVQSTHIASRIIITSTFFMGGPKFKSHPQAAYQSFPQFQHTRMGTLPDISSQLLPSILLLIHYCLPLCFIHQDIENDHKLTLYRPVLLSGNIQI